MLEQSYKQNAQGVIAQAADQALQFTTMDCLDDVSGSNVNYMREIRIHSKVSRLVYRRNL